MFEVEGPITLWDFKNEEHRDPRCQRYRHTRRLKLKVLSPCETSRTKNTETRDVRDTGIPDLWSWSPHHVGLQERRTQRPEMSEIRAYQTFEVEAPHNVGLQERRAQRPVVHRYRYTRCLKLKVPSPCETSRTKNAETRGVRDTGIPDVWRWRPYNLVGLQERRTVDGDNGNHVLGGSEVIRLLPSRSATRLQVCWQ